VRTCPILTCAAGRLIGEKKNVCYSVRHGREFSRHDESGRTIAAVRAADRQSPRSMPARHAPDGAKLNVSAANRLMWTARRKAPAFNYICRSMHEMRPNIVLDLRIGADTATRPSSPPKSADKHLRSDSSPPMRASTLEHEAGELSPSRHHRPRRNGFIYLDRGPVAPRGDREPLPHLRLVRSYIGVAD